jgi:dTDP-glucose 4,6-dehydratase
MATLLIIGGTGFFGKSILDSFQRGLLQTWSIDHVIVMARNVEGLKDKAPSLIVGKVTLISADISKMDYLPQAEFVIHAAASSVASNYLKSPLMERSNILSGVLNYCKLAKIFHQHSKILYVSSGAVYGTQSPELEMISEGYKFANPDDIPEGKRDYACAKRDAEKVFMGMGSSGLNVSVARCFSFVGPWLPLNQHFAIGNFIADGLAGREIEVLAKHRVYRSYMYADELVEWLMTIASASNQTCPIWNVGSEESILIDDLAQVVGCNFGLAPTESHYIVDKIDRYVPSTRKIQRELGIVMKMNLITAITKTIEAIESKISYD